MEKNRDKVDLKLSVLYENAEADSEEDPEYGEVAWIKYIEAYESALCFGLN